MDFEIGTKIVRDICSESGVVLLRKGAILNDKYIDLLRKHNIKWDELRRLNTETNDLNEIVYKEVYSSIMDLQVKVGEKSKLDNRDVMDLMNEFDFLHDEFVAKDIEVLELMKKYPEGEYLFKHSINVGLVASKIGKILKLSDEDQALLAKMGLFHDVGKLKIDSTILNKPSRLTEEEYRLIKQHPEWGHRLLANTTLEPLVLEGVLNHHERFDGTGYPNGIKADRISYFVRILSVADTFDAICSARVYKNESSVLYAIEELIKDVAAKKLDRSIVFPFANYIMGLSKGVEITLRNGKRGKILKLNSEYPNQPILEIEGFEPLDLFKENLTLIQVASV